MSEHPARVERPVRRALVAFPWRDRSERGDEIVGTVLDALAPDADRLPLRTSLDLIRGGLRIRRQRRPPLPVWLAYSSGLRISKRWVRWIFDDLDDPRYVAKATARRIVVTSPAWALSLVLERSLAGVLVSLGVVASLALVLPRWTIPRERQMPRRTYGLLAGGRDPGKTWVRRRLRGIASWVPARWTTSSRRCGPTASRRLLRPRVSPTCPGPLPHG